MRYEKQAELIEELIKESQSPQQAIATLTAMLEKSAPNPTYCQALKEDKNKEPRRLT